MSNNGGVGGNGASTQWDLQLRLAPPMARMEVDSGNSRDSSLVSNNGGVGGNGASTQWDLQLRLAPPTARMVVDSGNSRDSSLVSSCVSSDDSMVLVLGGCRNCLRYCMVTKKEFPTCIKCKQPCLVGFHGDKKRG